LAGNVAVFWTFRRFSGPQVVRKSGISVLAIAVGIAADGKSSKQPIGRWVPLLTGSNAFQKRENIPVGVFHLRKQAWAVWGPG
jgi:hypothetical protein